MGGGGGGGGEEKLDLWCTFECASPTAHTTFEGGGSWGEGGGGRSISAATSNLLSTSRITESALWNLLEFMDGKDEAAWLEGDSPSTLSASLLTSSPSFFAFSSSSSSVSPGASL